MDSPVRVSLPVSSRVVFSTRLVSRSVLKRHTDSEVVVLSIPIAFSVVLEARTATSRVSSSLISAARPSDGGPNGGGKRVDVEVRVL